MEQDNSIAPSVAEWISRRTADHPIAQRSSMMQSESVVRDLLEAEYRIAVARCYRTYRATEENEGIINQTARWLCQPSEKFFAVFCGTCGNGKTTMLSAVKALLSFKPMYKPDGKGGFCQCRPPRMVAAEEVVETRRAVLSNTLPVHQWFDLLNTEILCIDDFGAEPAEIVVFGNYSHPMTELLMHRYATRRITLMTTNLTPTQIGPQYDSRLADRMQECAQTFIFGDGSFRR